MEPCRKKPRTMSAAAPVSSNWSSLPRDLLRIIGEFTLRASVEDFMAFGGVCKSWRAVGRDDEFVKSIKLWWPRVPFLMLPEKEGCEERQLYSMTRRKIFMRVPLPEAKGNRCIESRFGWLLTLACSLENEGDIQLLNPFSGARILLPNYKTFPSFLEYKHDPDRLNPWFDFITRSVLSANPSHTSDFVVLVVLSTLHMAFWRNGDSHWTHLYSDIGPFLDVNYSDRDQSFYAVSAGGDICVWNHAAGAADPTPLLKVIYYLDPQVIRLFRWGAYLVESSAGDLLLLARNGQQVEDKGFDKLKYGTTEFRVYQMDVTTGEFKRVWSLNGDAIFVGHNATISIKVQPGDAIKSNHIYFSDDSIFAYAKWSPEPRVEFFHIDSESSDEEGSDDSSSASGKRSSDSKSTYDEEAEENVKRLISYSSGWDVGDLDARGGGGKDMGIYNLEDGSVQRFDHPDLETLSFVCPSLWVLSLPVPPRPSEPLFVSFQVPCSGSSEECLMFPLLWFFKLNLKNCIRTSGHGSGIKLCIVWFSFHNAKALVQWWQYL